MNNRDNKKFGQGAIHHIYNRGVGKMDIFRETADYLNFLKRLRLALNIGNTRQSALRIQPLPAGAFSILAYCLMPNHFHFLVRQNLNIPVTKLLSKVSTSFSKYFNLKYDHTGGVFQDQYKAALVNNDAYLLWVSAYIHQNPKVRGLVDNLEDYPYSSYLDYIGKREGLIADKTLILGMMKQDPQAYERFVLQSFDKIKERKDLEYLLLDN